MTREQRLIRRALELVRDGLRSGEIPEHNFNIRSWAAPEYIGCGTAQCIGGWTGALLHKAGYYTACNRMLYSEGIGNLFFSYPVRVSVGQAADAIDRFLAGQKPWPRSA